LVGDYSVGLMADGERAPAKTIELRVTVKAPDGVGVDRRWASSPW